MMQRGFFRPFPHRYFFHDPIRLACILAAGLLVYSPEMSFWLTLLSVACVQFCSVSIVARGGPPGWSNQWGPSLHPSVVSARMCLDWCNYCACSAVGALLLIRHFGGPDIVKSLGVLVVGICLLPDIRFCRWILADDWNAQSEHLRTGFFWRDPVKLGAMLSAGVACVLDRGTLFYVLLSITFLQWTSLLVFIDKYIVEIEVKKRRGLSALLCEREGQRLAFCLSPIAVAALRHSTTDMAGLWGAGILAALIVVPDLVRIVAAIVGAFRGWVFGPRLKTAVAVPPRTIIWLAKP